MPEASVVIIGGGAAGLSAAGALAHRGIDAVVLEQDAAVGGTWARRYDRLHLHTIRQFSGLAHYPIPKRYPRYLSRDQLVEYLREHARHLNLRIITGTTVLKIRRSAFEGAHAAPSTPDLAPGTSHVAPSVGAGWVVETGAAEWQCRAVVIATGQYSRPMIPAWPGRDSYTGQLVHSVAYANAAPYAGQRVLVVGAGNSGAEIATDLAVEREGFSRAKAPAVAISVRTPPPIVPRDPFGMPVQRTSILLSALPTAIANSLGRLTAKFVIGDLSRYGMPKGKFAPYSARRVPLIDVGFVAALKRGALAVKPAVERLTPDGVAFADGTSEPFDAIIAATGFTTGLESLLDAPGALDDHGEPIGASGDPTAHPGLYFVGFTHSLRGHLFEANLASRRLACNLERDLVRSSL